MTDIVDRMQGYENWQRREAAGLREHYSRSPAMPELAEMHEETADALKDARLEIERLRNALAIADAACASYWEWEYGKDGDDIPNSSLLVAWRKDYETRTLPGETG